MIGAGNAKEEAPEEEAPEEEAVGSLLPVDGLLGGGVVGCVGTNGLAAAFGEACMILGPAGMFMAVSDGASGASGAIAATSAVELETVVNKYKGTHTQK